MRALIISQENKQKHRNILPKWMRIEKPIHFSLERLNKCWNWQMIQIEKQ